MLDAAHPAVRSQMVIACLPRSRRPGWIANGRARRHHAKISRYDPCSQPRFTGSQKQQQQQQHSATNSQRSTDTRSTSSAHSVRSGSLSSIIEDDDTSWSSSASDGDATEDSELSEAPTRRSGQRRRIGRIRGDPSSSHSTNAFIYCMHLGGKEFKLGVSLCPEQRVRAAFTFRVQKPVVCARVAVPLGLPRYACEAAVLKAVRKHRSVTLSTAGREVFILNRGAGVAMGRLLRKTCQAAFATVKASTVS
eukprot:1106443-Pleurochrysis_carterae.AAC.1